MARTLIIKNADFSQNKITTITFSSIPCEGIELEANTMNITGLDPVVVGYTLTPEDTTDIVVWSSSDPTVVSVNAGTLTVNGIGTAILTATCGECSATMTVNVNIACVPTFVDGCSCMINTSTSENTVSTNSASRVTGIGSGNQATYYGSISSSTEYRNQKAIKIPLNVARIQISVSSTGIFYNASETRLVFTKDEWSGVSLYDYSIKPISQSVYNIKTESSKIIEVPSDADSFYFTTRLGSDYTSEDLDEAGLAITFLPAAV